MREREGGQREGERDRQMQWRTADSEKKVPTVEIPELSLSLEKVRI